MRPYGVLIGAWILAVGALYGLSCFVGSAASCAAATREGETAVRSQSVDAREFRTAIENGAILLDVRTPGEYAEGHIAGARLVDWKDSTFAEKVAALDRTKSYVIYCRSGSRSRLARKAMIEMGFTDVRDLSGGIGAWRAAGHPIE